MTEKTKLEVRQREIRSKLAELAGAETLTDEQRAEMRELTAESVENDTKLNALAITESAQSGGGDSLAELESRASVGRIFDAALSHRQTDGPEREIQEHFGIEPNQVPLSMLETRAVTPAPSDVGQNQAAIIPAVFPQSVAAFLGVSMPRVGVGEAVFPVLSTSATVHTPAADAAAAETTGAFTAEVLSPGRLQASFFYRREDAARFAGMDSALRQNLTMALGAALDKQVISGTDGLLTGTNLGNNAQANGTTYADYLNQFCYGRIDGKFATSAGDLRIVCGSATYADMGATYRANESDMNALDRLNALTGGVRVSAYVPAVSSNKQNALVRLGTRQDMTAPIWEGITILADPYTKSAKGQIQITAVMLYAVKILRSDGFHKQETNHS